MKGSGMETYRLLFSEDGIGVERKVEFEAPDAAKALIIAHEQAHNRSAELWKGRDRLCTIRRTPSTV